MSLGRELLQLASSLYIDDAVILGDALNHLLCWTVKPIFDNCELFVFLQAVRFILVFRLQILIQGFQCLSLDRVRTVLVLKYTSSPGKILEQASLAIYKRATKRIQDMR